YRSGSLPHTERLCAEVLSLPIFPELTSDQQARVIAAVRQLLGGVPPSQEKPCASLTI
ncbi:MAG: DegT/DnrJ/EryC1/StrS family aminotransferase, partial [Cyanobacteriota bacterium]|nr:DegT/DnrJ/EryC1/StrS family aminotransferase [Cyanobacteriota bacterium]